LQGDAARAVSRRNERNPIQKFLFSQKKWSFVCSKFKSPLMYSICPSKLWLDQKFPEPICKKSTLSKVFFMSSEAEKFERQFTKVLRLRFDERNRQLKERFTEVKERFNARGALYSSETMKALHKVLETELKESVHVLASTINDVTNKQDVVVILTEKKLQNMCSKALLSRKNEIEGLYASNVQQINRVLQNQTMLKPYLSLRDAYGLQVEEMRINISSLREKYVHDHGNLLKRITNKYLNNPIVVVVMIAVAVVAFVNKFYKEIKDFLQ
jgi:hypothetical protein